MKTSELFEARVIPDWVKLEDAAFKAILKKYGLVSRRQPKLIKDRWVFGGELLDTEKRDISLKLETRVAGLQKAIAKHLFDLHQKGQEVVTYDVSYYSGYGFDQVKDVHPRYLYKDDSLSHVEARVKDKLFVNTISSGGFSIGFQYGIENKDPTPPKTAESKNKVYHVVKSAK